jgi:hypothetical protein
MKTGLPKQLALAARGPRGARSEPTRQAHGCIHVVPATATAPSELRALAALHTQSPRRHPTPGTTVSFERQMSHHLRAHRLRREASAAHHLREVAGSVAVVVGAASALGKQLVLELHAAGAHVAACDGDGAGLEALAAEAKAESQRVSLEVMALLRDTLRPAVAALDKNHDGTVSDQEAFDFFDTNHDQELSPGELRHGLATLGIERASSSAAVPRRRAQHDNMPSTCHHQHAAAALPLLYRFR